jgi:trimeric autotransporter adhesin
VPTVPTVTGLRIEGAHTVPVGRQAQLKAIATMSDGSEQDVTGNANWSSNDNALASISQGGLLSALLPGTNVVNADYNGQRAQQPVTVTPF